MKKFLVLFCRYDPDNYRGYFRHEFEATDMEAAQALARKFIDSRAGHWNGDVEYQCYEIAAQDWGKLWNVKEQKHR